jgi:hypothetical protein
MKLNKTRTLGRASRLRELLLVSASGLLLGSLSPADARITKIAISSTAPAYGGATFGSVGAMSSSPAPHSARSIRATS